jgi:dipeptidyl aminopeptidase/acylaminoacyl peptidase
MSAQKKPYGLWDSPISAAALSQRVGLEDMAWDSDGETLVWVESRSSQSGLVVQTPGDARREITEPYKVRGGVGYGGGELSVAHGTIFFTEAGGRLYTRSVTGGKAHALTPPFGTAASPVLSPDDRWVLYVFSDGKDDLIALADAQGREWPLQIGRGADFYMQPAWHPSGEQIAWIEWDHPNMPWDGTRVKLARLAGSPPHLVDEKVVGGGPETAAGQPIFSPDGRWLAFIESGEEWQNLILLDLASGERRILLAGSDFDLMPPAWSQGNRSLGWSPDSHSLYSIRNARGQSSLWRIGLEGGDEQIHLAPYTSFSQLAVSTQGKLALIAAGPTTPTRLIVVENGNARIVARSDSELVPAAYIPAAQPLEWRGADGVLVYGVYYPPSNPDFSASGLPPAILNIHGGPTSAVSLRYNAEAAYFASRGYAYLEVNYRGSTGYGSAYRNALRQRWGDLDVEDAVSGGSALGTLGLAESSRLVIKGGSAGGYTVLNGLVRYPGRFKAGICLFGVSNLFTLDLDTHKFEAHYSASMVGQLPEAAGRYHAWSPVFHASQIRDPLYIFQGSDDKVVPPSQSEEIVAALQKTGVTHKYRLYPGEGHGFRKSENIADYLNETERFLMMQVLFAA